MKPRAAKIAAGRVRQGKSATGAETTPKPHKVVVDFDDDIPRYLRFLEEFEERSANVRLRVR